MSELLDQIKNLINKCSEDERKTLKAHLRMLVPHDLEKDWDIDADTILSAISRSSDLTKRGVRGIIAEATFINEVVPDVAAIGWRNLSINGDHPYDVLLEKGNRRVRIQVKLQRLEKGAPRLYYPKHYKEGSLYVVEVQKTRSGEKSTQTTLRGTDTKIKATTTVTEQTRPYRFGDFDFLAVNMHPSSGNWRDFRYTLGSWLLPRSTDEKKIEIFQPIAATPSDVWTDDLATCLQWLESGRQHRVLAELLHKAKAKGKKSPKGNSPRRGA